MSDFSTFDDSSASSSVSDRFHPIIVRQLRRLARSHMLLWTTVLLMAVLIAAFGACLLLIGARPTNLEMTQFWNLASVYPAQLLIGFIAFLPGCMYVSARINDELFDLSFTSKEILHGYFGLGMILCCYYTSIALPMAALCFVYGADLTFCLWSLFAGMVAAASVSLVYFSWLAKMQSGSSMWVVVVMLFFFGAPQVFGMSAVEGYIGVRYVMSGAMTGSGPASAIAPLDNNDTWMVVYLMLLWVLFGGIGYVLSRSHLENRSRKTWAALTMNFFVYGLTSATTTGIWAALRFGGVI